MMHAGDIQGQASQFRRTADYVGATVQHRSGQAGIEVRPGDTLAEDLAIPIGGRRRRRSQIGTDLRQVVVMVGGVRVGARAQRQHRATVEVEDEPIGLVDGGDPQGDQPGGRPARLRGILLHPDNLGAGEQRVTDRREAEERQPAVEQVGFDVLGGQRRLSDRDVADQARMRQRPRQPGDRGGQLGVQRQPQPVTENALVHSGQPSGERHRRRTGEDLAGVHLVEVRADCHGCPASPHANIAGWVRD